MLNYTYILQSTRIDPLMFDITSLIIMCCFEIICTGKVVSYMCHIFFDNQLSVILAKLEATHEKLIHLNVIRPMQIKINWLFITVTTVHFIASNIITINWIILRYMRNKIYEVSMVIIINI